MNLVIKTHLKVVSILTDVPSSQLEDFVTKRKAIYCFINGNINERPLSADISCKT